MFINLKEYFPKHEENRMSHEGDVVYARENYYNNKPSNLYYLVKKRYSWMNKYIKESDIGIELGCGAGFGKDFIKCKNFTLTDNASHPWVEKKVDAMSTPFKDNELDFVICMNVVHHIAYPLVFLKEMNRILKVGGRLIIQDGYASIFMRILTSIMRHEGYSLKTNPFDPSKPCNDKDDLWSANLAISNLLFDNEKRFYENVKGFKIIKKSYAEFFLLPLSGGVIAKTKTINLPFFVLSIFDKVDTVLTYLFPGLLALAMRVVLEKTR